MIKPPPLAYFFCALFLVGALPLARGAEPTAGAVEAAEEKEASVSLYFEGDALRESLLALTPAREEAVRRLDRTLTGSCRFVRAEILGLVQDGALISLQAYSSTEHEEGPALGVAETFFVYGLSEGVKRGEIWKARVYPAGKYALASADGAQQVNAFAVTKEWALRAMERNFTE